MARVRVAVGTSNPLKVRAARIVFSRYFDAEVVAISVDSGVGPQPAGSRKVVAGALRRAVDAMRRTASDFGVGVEAGPVEFPSPLGYLETQVAVVVDRECRVGLGLSASFELDEDIVRSVVGGGVELERAVSYKRRVPIGEGIGFVGIATRGFITRMDLTIQAIAMALIPFIEGYSRMASANSLAESLGARIEC